ncbi:MAG: sigma-70 family RNA polymerase sigma factor [Ktedonobacteraceae bacterium]
MTKGNSHNQWSELNDVAVIEAMLMNSDSVHWEKCSEYIRYFIEKQFSSLLPHLKDEIVQETMLSVHKGLSSFRYKSKCTTWLASIARNRAIDTLRRQEDITQREVHPADPLEKHEDGPMSSITNPPRTPEEIALTHERMRETFAAIEVFLKRHANYERNRQILQMILLDGYSYEETAQILGVPAPIVGYVARSARNYLRQELFYKPESNE